MKKTRFTTIVAGLAAMSLALTACGSGDQGSPDENEVTLRVTTHLGPDNWQTKTLEEYAEGVTERTNGSVKFEFFYQDALVPPAEVTDGLQSGTVDLAYTITAYAPDKFPIGTWISRAAFAGSNSPDAGTLQMAASVLDWAANDEEYLEELKGSGVHPILPRLVAYDSYGVLCDEPVTSLEAAKGKRVRVGGNAWAEEAKNLGMVPVQLPSTETYTSMQQGVIDCFMGGLSDVDSLGLSELGGAYTTAGLTGFDSTALLISDQTWDKLTDDQKEALEEESVTYMENWYERYRQSTFDFIQRSEDGGDLTIHEPEADMKEKISDYHEKLTKDLVADAPSSLSDPQATMDDYLAKYDAWLPKVEEAGFSTEDATWADFNRRQNNEAESISEWTSLVKAEVLDPYFDSAK